MGSIKNSINISFILKYKMLHCWELKIKLLLELQVIDEFTVSKHATQADTPNKNIIGRNLLKITFQA